MTAASTTSISNLQSLSGTFSEGDVAVVDGYHDAGDFGGGVFYFEPSPPDAATVAEAVGMSLTVTITRATKTSPIEVMASAAHGYVTGQSIVIATAGRNAAENGAPAIATWTVTVRSPLTFSLDDSSGKDTYPVGIAEATSNTIAVTTKAAHGLLSGQHAMIAGIPDNTTVDGDWSITVPANTITVSTISGTSKTTPGDTVTPTASSSALSGSPIELGPYIVKQEDTPAEIAEGIANLVNGNALLQSAKVSAIVSGSVVTILPPASLSPAIIWTAPKTGTMEVYTVGAGSILTTGAKTFSIGSMTTGSHTGERFVGDGGTAVPSRTQSGRWRRIYSGGLDVRWFGAKGDSSDDFPAFQSALGAISALAAPSSPRGTLLFVPFGRYLIRKTLVLTRHMMLQGVSGAGRHSGSQLEFPRDVDGIVVQSHYANLGSWTIIRDLAVISQSAGSGQPDPPLDEDSPLPGLPGHGVVLNGRARIVNVFVSGFQYDGVHIDTTTADHNANNFEILNCRIHNSGRHGLFVAGGNANSGRVFGVDCSQNAFWGVYDRSFLGNTYVGCHCAENKLGA